MAATPRDEIPAPGRAAVAAMLRVASKRLRGISHNGGRSRERVLEDCDGAAADLDKIASMLEGGGR